MKSNDFDKKMTNVGKEITAVKFREGECTRFEPNTGDEEMDDQLR